ncbi:MAG: hypothetical protein LBQ31_05620 [Bacteroidales bacterium]|jgi:hypothetical protein|nr:hypothetical protein [Bacteroidales bacterium]
MSSYDYIINELEIFIKQFSKVRVRYEHDKQASVHVIEIVPNDVYHLNEEYISWEVDMLNKFVTVYPTENICFISDDASVGIENEMYIKEGLDYAPFSVQQESDISAVFDYDLLDLQMSIILEPFYNVSAGKKDAIDTEKSTMIKEYSSHYLYAA